MFKRIVLCTALITLGMVLSLNAQPQPSPVQPSPIKRTILQRADVPGTNLEIIYATVEIAAGFKAGRLCCGAGSTGRHLGMAGHLYQRQRSWRTAAPPGIFLGPAGAAASTACSHACCRQCPSGFA
jgi:hypothetical protein